MFTLDLQDLRNLLASTTGDPPQRIDPMPGGASTRKFFRVTLKDRSAVAMFVPDLAHSDEIEKKDLIARTILGKEKNVVYVNVRVTDRPTWRGLNPGN